MKDFFDKSQVIVLCRTIKQDDVLILNIQLTLNSILEITTFKFCTIVQVVNV